MMNSPILKLTLKFSFFLLLALPILEVSLRLFAPQQIITADDIYTADNSGLGIKLLPNIDRVINTGEGPARIVTDEHGYRVSGMEERPANINILAIGDSFLLAQQVDYKETMTAILENRLSWALSKNVRIVNTGIGAYTPNHYLILARNELREQKYDMVVVFIYLGNDLITESVSYYPPIVPRSRVFRIPRNWSQKEIINSWLYPINDVLEKNSHLFILLKNQASLYLAQVGLSARSFPESLLVSSSGDRSWSVTASVLANIQAEAQKYDVPVAFVLLPSSFQVVPDELNWAKKAFNISDIAIDLSQPSSLLSKEMISRGLSVIDMYPPLRQAYAIEHTELYGKVDSHLSKEGHQFVADYLFNPILGLLSK